MIFFLLFGSRFNQWHITSVEFVCAESLGLRYGIHGRCENAEFRYNKKDPSYYEWGFKIKNGNYQIPVRRSETKKDYSCVAQLCIKAVRTITAGNDTGKSFYYRSFL